MSHSFASGMKSLGGTPDRVIPAHQRSNRRPDWCEIGNRLVVHHEVAGVEGLAQLLDRRETAHARWCIVGVKTRGDPKVSLRFVERGVTF